ncbi:hypothetical protein [Oceanobacillus sp. J11TS1]|uniref:hypothetical protein n=1 Tax=Oceanobacillus sp. J11TS1 TaxID=2807191 RepID=UPI001B0F7486|nr:hypothetical protein [Oceanobacillus sp. J11TS1]GIO24853.1 hypothetical protein J11TS1_34340 [Oceanobacillus sp. J11TS1]
MQVFSTFEHHISLEIAIGTLKRIGIPNENIFAVPLDSQIEKPRLFDTLHRADGTSLIDIGLAIGTGFSVIGASIGLMLYWGPIIWGLIGAFIGFLIGFAIRLYVEYVVKKRKRALKGEHSEVILIIDCKEEQAEMVESILWKNYAIGVAKVK